MWIWDKKEEVKRALKNYPSMENFPKIKGYNFDGDFNSEEFFRSFKNMAFQGSNLGIAMEIFQEILDNKVPLFLSCTGNMISSGNRELIAYLVKYKMVTGITTTAAAIEEDIIKCIRPFHLGSFDVVGRSLLDGCVGRIGNIFVPVDRYLYLEYFLNKLFSSLHATQKETGKACSAHNLAREAGLLLPKEEHTKEHFEESFLYWAAKNNIPVFCPGITDGAIGDITVFFKREHPDFLIDVVAENTELVKLLLDQEKTACLVLGGGIAKHFLLNSCIFRDGFDYAIYLTTATYHDGSDSGGNQEEAITWAKIKPTARRVKVIADATITLPLLLAGMKK